MSDWRSLAFSPESLSPLSALTRWGSFANAYACDTDRRGSKRGIPFFLRAPNDKGLSHRVARAGREASDPFMGGWASHADPGLGAAVWTGPSAGRQGGGRWAAETGVSLVGLPAPSPAPSFAFLVPAHAQPTASPRPGSSLLPPPPSLGSLPSLGAQPGPVGRYPVCPRSGTRSWPASGSPGRGERDRSHRRCLEQKQKKKQKEGELEWQGLGPDLHGNDFVCLCLGAFICRKDKNAS